MELFSRGRASPNTNAAPIRSSIALLIARLALVVVLFDLLYSLIFYFSNVFFHTPIEWHHTISLSMLGLIAIKNIIEVGFLIHTTLSWINTTYSIENGHLIIKKGIIHTIEDVYELKTIRAVEVDQSLLGKLFHFGDVVLKTSASGGYQVIVTLMGIADPFKYERSLNKYF